PRSLLITLARVDLSSRGAAPGPGAVEPRMSRTAPVVLAGLVLFAGVVGAGAAPANSRGAKARLAPRFFGVNFFGGRGTDRDVRQMQRGGIRSARIRIDWALIQPSRGVVYQWGP